MLTLEAPAKLNLTLEVLAKRPDGFHEVRSVMQTVGLSDSLYLKAGRNLEVRCDKPGWNPEKSLVSRAASLLREASGCSKGAVIGVNKRIPLLSGLGGDSSDAAATLRGLNILWELGLPRERLLELAVQLGSDVAFFLYGGTALARGRGEMVTPLPGLPRMRVVLMLPPVPRRPGKTRRLYASLKASHYTSGQISDRLIARLTAGGQLRPDLLSNVFDRIAGDGFPGLKEYREQFRKAGAGGVHLAGSGPALFTLMEDRAQAEEIYAHLKQQGLESYLAETLAAMDCME